MKVNNGCLHRHMDLLFLIWTGRTFLSFWMGLHLKALFRFLIAVAVFVHSSRFSCCCLFVSFFFTSIPSYLSSAVSFFD